MAKEFIFFTDTHYYLNQARSMVSITGLTSWFNTQLKITKSIFEYAKNYNVKNIIIGGDIFEEKDRIPSLLYNAVWAYYESISKKFNIYFNLGNHDIFMVSGQTSLRPFTNIVNVVMNKSIIDIDGCKVGFIPFKYNNAPKFDKPIDVCVTHAVVEGMTGGKRLKENISLANLRQYPLVLNGHIHTYQALDNVVNLGSFMRHDFSEAQDSKYFLHYKDGDYELVPIQCPDFFTFDYKQKLESEVLTDTYNFFRLNVPPSQANLEIFKRFNVSRNLIDEVKTEVRMESFLTEEEEIVKYIEYSGTKLDKERLIKTGLELIGV